MIPVWALSLVKSKWFWVAVAGLGLLTAGTVSLHNYGVARYNAGVAAERAEWTQVMAEAVEAANAQRAELQALRVAQDAESARLRTERDRALNLVREEIRNASTVEDQLVIYNAHRSGLRDETAERFARARDGYLSGLVPNTGGQPGPVRGPDIVADVGRSRDLRLGAGVVVGNCFS